MSAGAGARWSDVISPPGASGQAAVVRPFCLRKLPPELLSVAGAAGVLEAQDLAYASHRHSLG